MSLVAAWFLVLQSVLGAFAFSNGPQAAQFDAFGNVICTHDGAAELAPDDPHEQPIPRCCAFGCIMSGATFSSPPTLFALSRTVVFEAAAFTIAAPAPVLLPRERSASGPRAPPQAA